MKQIKIAYIALLAVGGCGPTFQNSQSRVENRQFSSQANLNEELQAKSELEFFKPRPQNELSTRANGVVEDLTIEIRKRIVKYPKWIRAQFYLDLKKSNGVEVTPGVMTKLDLRGSGLVDITPGRSTENTELVNLNSTQLLVDLAAERADFSFKALSHGAFVLQSLTRVCSELNI